ncbi:Inner membrane protein YebE [Roseivivax jejudonensis]|uniref:Inner membrane protein YebE n=1 Tax=Roseivivax jejudonensis TaxID=1529041 RepID=A0A1X6ZY89_9RHOB|nr:DUF533 domain-containing protein [Roseivivax jejudonensis]SLN65111.1 Inner membrane protein YebE [Roseivivax jejudonensis]
MSMKRILGTMLATRMAGRGRRRGALGSASALGLLGSRRRIGRSGMGSKLGLAALGYMAYQAYQSHQKSQGTQTQHAGHTSSHGTSGGGLLDKVKDAANEILGGGSASQASSTATAQTAEPDAQDLKASEEAAERFSEDEALLMIRAMITAAYADGSLSQDERARIVQAIDDADATADERATMEREIANPKPLDDLLAQVNDDETAEEFYFASRAAIDGDSEGDRHYLRTLQQRLNLSQEQVDEADAIAS